jgi:hypothetical protein
MKDVYFERSMDTTYNIFFRHFACMTYFTHPLVPVLAPNYKQHILLDLT